jgi:hypothetical protein
MNCPSIGEIHRMFFRNVKEFLRKPGHNPDITQTKPYVEKWAPGYLPMVLPGYNLPDLETVLPECLLSR